MIAERQDQIYEMQIELLRTTKRFNREERQAMASYEEELARLQSAVGSQTTVVASASTLLVTLAQLIRDNANDPAALAALADQIETDNSSLSTAVADSDDVLDTGETPGNGEPPVQG